MSGSGTDNSFDSSRGIEIKRSIREIVIILLIPLLLAIIYNLGSPHGIPIMPQRQDTQSIVPRMDHLHAHTDQRDGSR